VSGPVGGGGAVDATGLPPAQEVVEGALAAARAGSDQCVVVVEETHEVEVRFANNTTTTNGSRRDRRVTVISTRQVDGGTAAGVARRGGDVDVIELVRAAEKDAAGSPPADDASPLLAPGATGMPSGPSRRFPEPPATTGLPVLSGVLEGLSGAFARARRSHHVLAGFAEHRETTEYLGTSTGVRLAHGQPQGALHLVARSQDGIGSTWAGVGTTDFRDVSVEGLEARLGERLGWAARRLERPVGRYEVLLPPEAVSDLMVGLAQELSGRNAEDGRNVFSRAGGGTRLGETLTPVPFDLRSDPGEPGLECMPFLAVTSSSADSSVFDNGLPLSRTSWISDGSLAALVSSRHSAEVAGVPVTPGIDNLTFVSSAAAQPRLEEMIASTKRALLLTCLWYIREVDPQTMLLTGLTRDGVYLVEDGEVVGAVNNFRFNESPVGMLGRLLEVGATEPTLPREWGDYFNRAAMPPVRVEGFNMSSVSQAS